MNLNNVEQQVLTCITPTQQDRTKLNQVVDLLISQVTQQLSIIESPAMPLLVGSIAKDTYLRHALDIDLFLQFPSNIPKTTLETTTRTLGDVLLQEPEARYAEHPYIRGMYQGFCVELVPCYRITSVDQKQSAVDRTPLHTEYIKTHLKDKQKDHVRLLKQFLKGIGCYGAEAAIEGFSGYLCELLIIFYHSFMEVITQVQQWKPGQYLTLKTVNTPKFSTPLTFIDPVDPQRNVASAVSKESFQRFITACIHYHQQPQLTFFYPQPLKPWSLKKIQKVIKPDNRHFFGLQIMKPDTLDENLYPQLRKAVYTLCQCCERNGFGTTQGWFHIDENENKIYFIVEPEYMVAPLEILHAGPPVSKKDHVHSFLKKWKHHPQVLKGPFQKDTRYYVLLKRPYRTLSELFHTEVKTLSLGKHITESIQQQVSFLEGDNLFTDNLRLLWTTILDARNPWER